MHSICLLFELILSCLFVLEAFANENELKFESHYILDENFAKGFNFKDVTDVEVNSQMGHVFVLQRSKPSVTIWNTRGELIFAWNTTDLGYPHSITLNGSDPLHATVWITDMAGRPQDLLAGNHYGHCIKLFTYYGKYTGSIGKCGQYTNGSGLNPIQFDKVTDIAWTKGLYYIADGDLGGLNNRVVVLNALLDLVDVWNNENVKGSSDSQFNLPHTIAVDKCSRIWVVDAQNSRIKVYSYDGIFLGKLDCFNGSYLYGLDFLIEENQQFIVTTALTVSSGNVWVLMVPFVLDCSNIKMIGDCRVQKKFVLSWQNNYPGSMLHSITVDSKSYDIYISQLPGTVPPLKFTQGKNPPVGNISTVFCGEHPPEWPDVWSSTALLTPYTKDPLETVQIEYDSSKWSMYFKFYRPSETIEYLVVKDLTYIIKRDTGIIECLGPVKKQWSVPYPNFLDAHQCTCRGNMNVSGVNSVIWQCPSYNSVNWFWFKQNENVLWRIFMNNITNPMQLPLIGDYTMINFATFTTKITELKTLYDVCFGNKIQHSKAQVTPLPLNPIAGFSHNCSNTNQPKWPEIFYLTATMFPTNNYEPLPAQVLYYWKQYSQKTSMYLQSSKYNAYLIKNNSFITTEFANRTVECINHLHFGPPRPNWMIQDCQCMGTLTHGSFFTLWPTTTIAVCALEDNRVFWTWYGSTDTSDYLPVLFFETLAPIQEGTSLSFADYHNYYPVNMLIDLNDFLVPDKCKK